MEAGARFEFGRTWATTRQSCESKLVRASFHHEVGIALPLVFACFVFCAVALKYVVVDTGNRKETRYDLCLAEPKPPSAKHFTETNHIVACRDQAI